MSRSIEDRLVAALEARAELVTPEDLRTIVVPDRPRRLRRGAVILLAAAASASAVATPLVLAGGDGVSPEPDPLGPPSVGVSEPTESGSPTGSPTEPGDVVVSDRQRADVDGDGRPDEVRVMFHGSDPDEPAAGSVEVSLASGATGTAEVPFGYPPRLLPAFDINGDGREQVLMSHTEGGDGSALLVYTWHEGGLVRMRADGEGPLGVSSHYGINVTDYYVGDRGFFSWVMLDDPPDFDASPIFEVQVWSWSAEGDLLVSAPAGRACVDVSTAGPPQPCTGQPAS